MSAFKSRHRVFLDLRSTVARARWPAAALTVGLACALFVPCFAATILVTDSVDAIPAPPGSLRWAIELSNSNGTPDEIVVVIDVDRITLVAPLPALTEGALALGQPPGPGEAQAFPGSLTLDGDGLVPSALTIASAGNVLAGFRFEGFTGPDVLRIEGHLANDNLVAGCGFFGPGPDGNVRIGVRIVPENATGALPTGNVIRHSIFDGLATAVAVHGLAGPGIGPSDRFAAAIERNWFGLDRNGLPGQAGNARAIDAVRSGRVVVAGNTVAGPGGGVRLDQAERSVVAGNRIGVPGEISSNCFGTDGPGIEVVASADVEIRGNEVLCSAAGVVLGPGSDGVIIDGNDLGSRQPGQGNAGQGLLLDGVSHARARANRVFGNGGAGIEIANPASPGSTLSCNRIGGNAGGSIVAPDLVTPPPLLTAADPLAVSGVPQSNAPSWIEMFGDDGDGPAVYQGATAVPQDQNAFRHPLPVLGLGFEAPTVEPGSAISFDTAVPASHVATDTSRESGETSVLSDRIAASAAGLVYDLVRGDLGELARNPDGGVDLGGVLCLAEGIQADGLPVIDADVPAPGRAFFYVSRRRSTLAATPGTYDPAVCLLDAGSFEGPRAPSAGDCGP